VRKNGDPGGRAPFTVDRDTGDERLAEMNSPASDVGGELAPVDSDPPPCAPFRDGKVCQVISEAKDGSSAEQPGQGRGTSGAMICLLTSLVLQERLRKLLACGSRPPIVRSEFAIAGAVTNELVSLAIHAVGKVWSDSTVVRPTGVLRLKEMFLVWLIDDALGPCTPFCEPKEAARAGKRLQTAHRAATAEEGRIRSRAADAAREAVPPKADPVEWEVGIVLRMLGKLVEHGATVCPSYAPEVGPVVVCGKRPREPAAIVAAPPAAAPADEPAAAAPVDEPAAAPTAEPGEPGAAAAAAIGPQGDTHWWLASEKDWGYYDDLSPAERVVYDRAVLDSSQYWLQRNIQQLREVEGRYQASLKRELEAEQELDGAEDQYEEKLKSAKADFESERDDLQAQVELLEHSNQRLADKLLDIQADHACLGSDNAQLRSKLHTLMWSQAVPSDQSA